MPDIVFEKLDLVPEGLREFAAEKDGKVVVKVVPQVKLDEFRTNNVTLSQERDALTSRVGLLTKIVGEDPEKFSTEVVGLREIAQQVKDGKLKGSTDIAAEVNQRVAAMKEGYDKQILDATRESNAWKEKAGIADTRLKRTIIDRHVTDAVLNDKSGAEPRALTDILSRAYSLFHVTDDGKLVPKDGEAVIYGADGASPQTPLEWLGKLKESAPYFFKGSTGGGANGAQNGKQIGNLSNEAFQKLSPTEKLKAARKAGL